MKKDPRWWFDAECAALACEFFPDMLQHVKGATGPLTLLDWQKWLVGEIFGWKEVGSNLRRYRYVYCEVPRKNGKTTLAAGIMLLFLLFDKEPGAEVYSAATTRDQAGIIYDIMSEMVKRNSVLLRACKPLDSKKRIVIGNSYFQSCSSQAGAVHGTNPHALCFDELHEQPDRKLWEAFQTGFGARSQPLFFSITTAGWDKTSVCYEQHRYARGVLDGLIDDPRFLPVLFSADEEDDWTDPDVWAKANPSLGASVSFEFLEGECRRAQEVPGLENSFRRLHLNQWTEQESRLIQMRKFDQCVRKDLEESDYHGHRAFAGMDFASTRDVVAVVLDVPLSDGSFAVLPRFWIPEENVDRRAKADQKIVRRFADQGWIQLTPGDQIDQKWLAQDVFDFLRKFNVIKIGYDAWNADGVVQELARLGIPISMMEKMVQTVSTYNEPIKDLLGRMSRQKVAFSPNPVLRWMASNATGLADVNGNLRWDKSKSQEKIDGLSAMSMGHKLLLHYGNQHSAYTAEGSGVVLF